MTEIPLEPPRGMDDLLPEDTAVMKRLIDAAHRLFKLYGYSEVDTPTVEYYELFAAKSGAEIRERMYVFEDVHGRKLALRPEMTAPIARLVAGKLSRRPMPLRLGYVADCYRLDEPQWGRRRRFFHAGFELFGSSSPMADLEILRIATDYFTEIGLNDVHIKIGHVGLLRSVMRQGNIHEDVQDLVLSLLDRGRFDEALNLLRSRGASGSILQIFNQLQDLQPKEFHLIEREVAELLRGFEGALRALANLQEITDSFRSLAPERPKLIYHPVFARGLAYYTGMIFEVYAPESSIALAGGGRYDQLVQLFGGREVPAVGFAIGVSRIHQYITTRTELKFRGDDQLIYLITLGERSNVTIGAKIATELRRRGVPVEEDVVGRGLSEGLSYAERRGARFALVLGEREVRKGVVALRDLVHRRQVEVGMDADAILNAIREHDR
ncbi:MAG: histidine--tRNA ligase [Aigarchaeota archaeon]|nr:histidine--tRNA ligase [Aigarchaeota archaeon]MDW8092124.1 histidine--tRNA ligase [Nitrososphaerota archaeon]